MTKVIVVDDQAVVREGLVLLLGLLVFAALKAGARGFLTKDADSDDIARAVATVMRGDAQLDPTVQRRLLDTMSTSPPQHAAIPVPPAETTAPAPAAASATAPGARRGELPDRPTSREGEVLTLIADGLSNAEIAARLHITEATVKTHINNLFAKAHLRDPAQAVTYAFRHGMARPH
ncbi:DNA-binding response regulator [Nonomuraea sp. NPDC049400]|uniref:DNA-binding response regulator n=1 Tax=Nonomuraea sp. NPDC049400 TaxID=3364352 RepID=UPI0037A67214